MQDHEFNLRPSKQYLCIVSALVISSLIMLVCLNMNGVLKCVLLAVVVAYSMHMMGYNVLMQGKDVIIALRRLSTGDWCIRTAKGTYPVSLLGDSTVTSIVMILRFRTPNTFWPRSCVIFPDALAPDGYRRLLVMLRIK